MAGFAEWRNTDHMGPEHGENMAIRLKHIYERRTARTLGETLAGALHHEDPRLRPSGKTGVWKRTGAAFMSVLASPGEDGKERMAFAPVVGSLGSGLTTMTFNQRRDSFGDGLERSGIVYSHYLIRALYHEFSPEIWSFAPKFVKKYHPTDALIDQP